MDQNRQIRFFIPPFFLIGSVFLADSLSCLNLFHRIAELLGKDTLAIAGALGASTIPLGFLIGTISVGILKIVSFVMSNCCLSNWNNEWEGWDIESPISNDACRKIWPQLDIWTKSEVEFKNRFYISATFDHGILPERINKWTMRRWNAFNTNVNCLSALGLSWIVCEYFEVKLTPEWYLSVGVVAFLLIVNARFSWQEIKKMIEFQAGRKFCKKNEERLNGK